MKEKHNQRVAIDLLNRNTGVFQDKTATINPSDYIDSIYRFHLVTVSTRIFSVSVGHPYEPSLSSVTEWVVDPIYSLRLRGNAG